MLNSLTAGAGASSTQAVRWSGIQSCRGSEGQVALPSTSDEATIDDYSRTATSVELRGVQLGPSDELSCGPLDFAAVVTHDDGGLTLFVSDDTHSCISPTGRALMVRALSGSVIDLSVPGKRDVTIKFMAHLESVRDADAGVTTAVSITCSRI